jgi:amino acid transporter
MTRNLILIILASALLSLILATVGQLVFSDVLPYKAGEDEAMSWYRQAAFLTEATAWISAEVSGLLAIVLAAQLWKRHSFRKS